MSLLESQQFFYDLCADPKLLPKFKAHRGRVLKKYFHEKKDQAFLSLPSFERFEIYRKHISYGLLGGIASAFPQLRSLLNEKEWNNLLNDFYLKRLTLSPIARQVFYEFSFYLQNYRGPLLKRFPYLCELAEYEALDLKLYYAQDVEIPKTWTNPNREEALALIPILNPHLELRLYHWPFHHLGHAIASPKKMKRGIYPLMIYRDPKTLELRQIESNELTAKMIELLKQGSYSVKKILLRLLKNYPVKNKEIFCKEALEMLGYFYQQGVILGYKK